VTQLDRSGALVDLSGPIGKNMWHYAAPYFEPRLGVLPQPPWLADPIYSEVIEMPLQSGTYLETAAHVDPERERIPDVALERVVLVPAIAVRVQAGRLAAVDRDEVEQAVRAVAAPPYTGFALLIGTGWSERWAEEDFVGDGPYLTEAVIDFVVEERFGILGGDFPRFDNPRDPSGHLHKLFATSTLLLAPLYDLAQLGDRSGRLIAAPLRIDGASATPVRAVWVSGAPEASQL